MKDKRFNALELLITIKGIFPAIEYLLRESKDRNIDMLVTLTNIKAVCEIGISAFTSGNALKEGGENEG